ncbi:hypothetical protein ACFBZI_07535 [Moraxella sp. ZJ142]|uniref:hypothetical protein n=1 Tax=Moraxella marmotae TaxID=3344520 RepID=UPI0035D49A7D
MNVVINVFFFVAYSLFVYVMGFLLARIWYKPKKTDIVTIDECVQRAVDKQFLKGARGDKIDVADLSHYTAIVGRDSVIIVNPFKQL